MPTLLRPWRLLNRDEPQHQAAEPVEAPREQSESAGAKRLFLLVPTDGGLSFHLAAFPDTAAAAAYVRMMASPIDPQPRHHTFWVLDSPDAPEAAAGPLEAVVMVREADRQGVVGLHSFVEMESALSYVRQELEAGLQPHLVILYWASPVELAIAGPAEDAGAEPAPTALPPLPRARTASMRRAQPACATEQAPAVVRTVLPAAHAAPGATRDTPAKATQAAATTAPPPPPRIVSRIMAWRGWDGLAPLVTQAALLKESAYEHFDRDPFAAGRARLIVALAVVAAAIGASGSGLASAIVHVPSFAIGWAAYAFAVYSIGTQAFPGHRSADTLPRLIRALGLASAPAFLLVLGAVPTYGPLFVLGVYIWVLFTTTTAVTVPLELSRDSAIIVATVGCMVLFTVSQIAPILLV